MATGNLAVGGPQQQIQQRDPGRSISFRRATTFRSAQLVSTVQATLSTAQTVEITVEGSGYIYGIDLHVFAVTSANAATVVFAEDAPWSAAAAVVLRDVNGELVNLPGISLRFANLYGAWAGFLETGSADTTRVYNAVSGSGGTGGSFRFHLFVPVGINRRTLVGILGNQDRAQRYQLRSDLAAAAAIYTTPPTTQALITIERYYENYAVPAPQNAANAPQAEFPDAFGVLHYITQSLSPSSPQGSAVVNHYLARVGNTWRYLILVFRSGAGATPRAQADTDGFSRIQFMLGDTTIFSETSAYRRMLMFRRFGFDAPAGVYVYDWITDIVAKAGDEMGEDYMFTQGLVNAQFQVSYNAGWAAGSSLIVITDDLQIPPDVDIYNIGM